MVQSEARHITSVSINVTDERSEPDETRV